MQFIVGHFEKLTYFWHLSVLDKRKKPDCRKKHRF